MDIKKFSKKYNSDEEFRKKAIIKLTDALRELGVDEDILSENIQDVNTLNSESGINEMGKNESVWVYKSDDQKNSTAIIIGMAGIEELKDIRLIREFEEFKAFKKMKLKRK